MDGGMNGWKDELINRTIRRQSKPQGAGLRVRKGRGQGRLEMVFFLNLKSIILSEIQT